MSDPHDQRPLVPQDTVPRQERDDPIHEEPAEPADDRDEDESIDVEDLP